MKKSTVINDLLDELHGVSRKELTRLNRQLKKLVRQKLEAGAPYGEVDKAVKSFFAKNKIGKRLAIWMKSKLEEKSKAFVTELKKKNAWVADHTFDEKESAYAQAVFSKIDSEFARLDGTVQSAVLSSLKKGMKQGLSSEEISEKLSAKLKKPLHVARTVVNTGVAAYSNAVNLDLATNAGAKRFKYDRASAERSFCKSRLGKVYTLDELKAMDNKQGLNVETHLGGYNCRHYLTAVFEKGN